MLRRKRFRHLAHITVVGVGNGGITAVNHMIAAGITSVDFVTVDSDEAALAGSRAPVCLQLSPNPAAEVPPEGTAVPDAAVPAKHDPLADAVSGSDMVFVVGGLGGQTGLQLAPRVAQVARAQDALATAIVTFPFSFEGKQRAQRARQAIRRLRRHVHTLIVIPNDRLLALAGGELAFHETYRLALEIWQQSIQGISELVNAPGLVNVDFADVRAIMTTGGASIIATGNARGPRRAQRAARQATRSRHLDVTIDGARGVLFNVTGGLDLTLHQVRQAAAVIKERAHPEANIIFGAAIDVALEGEVRVTVIATGCGVEPAEGHVGREPQGEPRGLPHAARGPGAEDVAEGADVPAPEERLEAQAPLQGDGRTELEKTASNVRQRGVSNTIIA